MINVDIGQGIALGIQLTDPVDSQIRLNFLRRLNQNRIHPVHWNEIDTKILFFVGSFIGSAKQEKMVSSLAMIADGEAFSTLTGLDHAFTYGPGMDELDPFHDFSHVSRIINQD